MTSNVFTVLDALSAFNIPVFWQPLAEPTRCGVGVTEANRLATWQALRAASEGQSLYASPVGAAGRSQRLLSSAGDAIPNDLRGADAWHVFREITSPTSLGHHGADVSTVIVFWKHRRVDDVVNARLEEEEEEEEEERIEPVDVANEWPGAQIERADTRIHRAQALTWLVTDVENPVVSAITEDEPGTGEVMLDGRRIATTELFSRYERTMQPRFPVDIVYTWVDGNDPSWIDKRQRALAATKEEYASSSCQHILHNPDGLLPARFTSRDELLYSMRSVAQFADFVRRVFIVTDGQVPEWLDSECPDLAVVDHREIFDPSDRRPTFNSHAIESRLHRISGLSEHYIYMNDDVFFGRRVTPWTFFWPSGAAKFFLSTARIPSGPPNATELSVTSAAKNGRDLLFETVGYLPLHKIKHTPHPQRRSLLYEMETKFGETFSRLSRAANFGPLPTYRWPHPFTITTDTRRVQRCRG